MADENTADVKVQVRTDDSRSQVDQLSQAFKQFSSDISSQVKGVTDKLSSITDGFAKVKSAILSIAAGGGFAEVIRESNEYAHEVENLSKILGITTEKASELDVGLRLIGVSAEQYVGIMQRLIMRVRSGEDGLNALGIATRDSNNKFLDGETLLNNTANALMNFREGTERDVAAVQAVGRNWASFTEVLRLNNEMKQRAAKDAQDLGLVMSKDGVEAAFNFKVGLNEVQLVLQGVGKAISEAVMPRLTALSGQLREQGPQIIEWSKEFAEALKYPALVAGSLFLALKDIGDGLAALFAETEALAHGDLAAFNAIAEARDEQAKKNEDQFHTFQDNILNVGAAGAPPKGAGSIAGGAKPGVLGGGQVGTAGPGLTQKGELEAITAELQEQDAITKAIGERQVQDGETRKKILETEAASVRDLSKISISTDRDALKEQLSTHQISAEEYARLATDLSLKEQKIDDDYFAKLRALRENDAAEVAKIDADQEKSHAEGAKRIVDVQREAARETRKIWDQVFEAFTSAFSTAIKGVIMGTQTLRQAMNNLGQSLLLSFIDMGIKMVAQWVKNELIKTFATQTGVAARVALESEGSSEVMVTKGEEAMAVVSDNAAEAASGAASSQASIPIVGPYLAAAAFAAILAMVLGARGLIRSAAGGYSVPANVNPMTQLHAEEMVLPRDKAKALDKMLANGGDGAMHLHVHAIDSKSVERLFANNGRALAAGMRRAKRSMNTPR